MDSLQGIQDVFASFSARSDDLLRVYRLQQKFYDYAFPLEPRTFTLALAVLASKRAREDSRPARGVLPKLDKELIDPVVRYARLSEAVYEKEDGVGGLEPVHRGGSDNSLLAPVHAIYENPDEIILCVRGTATFADVLTDVTLATHTFKLGGEEVEAHLGCLEGARKVLLESGLVLATRIQQAPEKRVVVTGHSLGGGVAAILSAMLEADGIPNQCVTFGSAAAVGASLAERLEHSTISIVNHSDCVPRLSYQGFANLARSLQSIDWQAECDLMLAALVPSSPSPLQPAPPALLLDALSKTCRDRAETIRRDLDESVARRKEAREKEPPALFPAGRTYHLCQEGIVLRPRSYWQNIEMDPMLLEDHFMKNYVSSLVAIQT